MRLGLAAIMLCVISILSVLYFLLYTTYREKNIDLYSSPEYIIKYAPTDGIIHYKPEKQLRAGDDLYSISNRSEDLTEKMPTTGHILYTQPDNTKIEKGDAICKITPSEIDEIYGIIKLDSTFTQKLQIGQKVDLYLDNDSDKKKYDGYISEIYPSVDNHRSYCAKISIETEIQDKVEFININSMRGSVKILLTNKPLLKRILHL